MTHQSSSLLSIDRADATNPLDAFEELLDASPYQYERLAASRLHFHCSGKQGDYLIMMEWNDSARIIKIALVIETVIQTAQDKIEQAILKANDAAWYGFFMIDGVGHIVYKSLLNFDAATDASDYLFQLEDKIDNAIDEADRFIISLSVHHNMMGAQSLFPDDMNDIENLSLMFSDIKGQA